MAIKLILTAEEINNKVFTPSIRGYSPLDVDSFLDSIIKDYQQVEANVLLKKKELDDLNEKIKSLEEKVNALEIDNSKLHARMDGIKDTDNVSLDNLDLIKKINALEKFLWQHGFNPNIIK